MALNPAVAFGAILGRPGGGPGGLWGALGPPLGSLGASLGAPGAVFWRSRGRSTRELEKEAVRRTFLEDFGTHI